MSASARSEPQAWADLQLREDDPRLDCTIQQLRPTPRGLKACRQLGVETVRDFLRHGREDFCSLRNCGKGTYQDLSRRVHNLLNAPATAQPTPTAAARQTPLLGLINNPRAERAFFKLGLRTVGDFLDTPRETLMAVKGFGERSWWDVSQRIQEVLGQGGGPAPALLPESLLEFPVAGLGLRSGMVQTLERLGGRRIEDLLALDPDLLAREAAIGEQGLTLIRQALDLLVRVGTEHTVNLGAESCDFLALINRLNSVLDSRQRDIFRRRVGMNCPTAGLPEVARQLRIPTAEVRVLEEGTRQLLHERAPALLARLKDEAERELRAFDGIILGDRLADGSLLQGARQAADAGLPLRLLRFLFARSYFLYGNLLCEVPPKAFQRLRHVLRQVTRGDRLPVPLAEALSQARRAVPEATAGLVLHLCKHRHQLRVQLDPRRGEVLHRGVQSSGDRLAQLLEDLARPASVEDLLFHYRDLYHRGNLGRIQDELRSDPRFLEVNAGIWSLRRNHQEELRATRPEAETVVEILENQSGRLNIYKLHKDTGLPERKTMLVIDCLRRDRRVRYLGRGVFCLRRRSSTVMDEIHTAFHRAMGEIVESLFLSNQHPRRRRLVECLLHENRAFVRCAEDRIDLLTNYPFNDERLLQLYRLIEEHLDLGQGYAPAGDLLTRVNATDLGGTWLNETFLVDLLRRGGQFEILPGNLIAKRELCLSGWIQQKARESLRSADCPLSPQEVLAEIPELASFAESLEQLLEQDPMVQMVDGMRFSVL